jgi:uncharacterized membrane protein YedE/YeeE
MVSGLLHQAPISVYLMGFVIFVSGLGAFGSALAYAIRPTERRLALMRPLSLASIFAALCSFFVGIGNVLEGAAATSEWSISARGHMLMGLSETIIPLFMAFAFLAVAWLLVAVGHQRME